MRSTKRPKPSAGIWLPPTGGIEKGRSRALTSPAVKFVFKSEVERLESGNRPLATHGDAPEG